MKDNAFDYKELTVSQIVHICKIMPKPHLTSILECVLRPLLLIWSWKRDPFSHVSISKLWSSTLKCKCCFIKRLYDVNCHEDLIQWSQINVINLLLAWLNHEILSWRLNSIFYIFPLGCFDGSSIVRWLAQLHTSNSIILEIALLVGKKKSQEFRKEEVI